MNKRDAFNTWWDTDAFYTQMVQAREREEIALQANEDANIEIARLTKANEGTNREIARITQWEDVAKEWGCATPEELRNRLNQLPETY